MIRHYLVSAFANIARAPVTTTAKILTLALGLAAMIAVAGIVSHWRPSDSQITPPGGRVMLFTRSVGSDDLKRFERPAPATQTFLAKYLREDIPEFEAIARYQPRGEVSVSAGDPSSSARKPRRTFSKSVSSENGSVSASARFLAIV